MNETTTSHSGDKRAWRGVQRTSIVGKSRLAWRWILSLTAVGLMIAAAMIAWPSPAPRTLLLTLSDDREDRNTIPPVPYIEADLSALAKWAQTANVPVCQRSLDDIQAPQTFVRSLLAGNVGQQAGIEFQQGNRRKVKLQPGDTLVIYVKGHGIALDLGSENQPRVVPLLVTSLTEDDLSGNWGKSDGSSRDCTLDVAELLAELATLKGIPKVVILDALHLSYDPRLGTLANAFSEAVEQSIPDEAEDLWVILPAGNAEVAADDAQAPGTSFVVSLKTALTRKALEEDSRIELPQLVAEVAEAIHARQGEGFDSFYQRPRLLSAAASQQARVQVPSLPRGLLVDEPLAEKAGDKKSAEKPAANKSARRRIPLSQLALQQSETQEPPSSTPAAAPQQAIPEQPGTTPALPASAAPPMSADAAPASTGTVLQGASASTAPKVATKAAPQPQSPVDDLDWAWQLRDRLRRRSAQLPHDSLDDRWSPVHFAPHQWRRLEGILVGFDQRAVSSIAGDGRIEDGTLAELCNDLEALDRWLKGSGTEPQLGVCATIAQAYRGFRGTGSSPSVAWESLQAHEIRRQQDATGPTVAGTPILSANQALKAFAESAYDATDLIQLHGHMACLPDGGPDVGDDLDDLLELLREFRRLLAPNELAGGRLDKSRLRKLDEVAGRLKQLQSEIDGTIATYAHSALGRSSGRLLRIRLLLGSPLLSGDDRLALRQAALSRPPAGAQVGNMTGSVDLDWQVLHGRLERNVRWTLGLLRVLAPSNGDALRPPNSATSRLEVAIESVLADSDAAPADRFTWTHLGRHFLALGEELPAQIAADHRRFRQDGELSAAELLDLYLLSILLDGRDARRATNENLPAWIAQPLGPERLPNRIMLAADPLEIHLSADDRKDGAPLEFVVQVQSESPPPYDISLEWSWPRGSEVRLQWEDGKPIHSLETIRLEGMQKQLKLRIFPPDEDRVSEPITISARAELVGSSSFADVNPAEVQIACQLPRPDRVRLVVVSEQDASEGSLAEAQEWQRSGEQGGRLWLFPNRSGSFRFYLTATDNRKLHARLYRVPTHCLDQSRRLFDPKAPGRLSKEPAALDAEIRKAFNQEALDRIADLKGHLLAQTDEKSPLVLGPGKPPILAALQPPMPLGTPVPATSPMPPSPSDVTAGLVLVLFSDDLPREPYVKWLELQPYVPDDLLEVKNSAFTNGRLSFEVGWKDPRIASSIGLAEAPLSVRWDETSRGSAPSDERIQQGTFEASLDSPEASARLQAMIPPEARWPVEVQLQIDGYPRALWVELERSTGEQVTIKNLKPNRPPAIHLGQLRVENRMIRILPHRSRLPFPAPLRAADTEDKDLQILLQERVLAGEFAIPIGPRQIRGTCVVDLQAEVSREDFASGARIEFKVNGQNREPFVFDRRVAVQLAGVQAGSIKLANQVTDFTGLAVETSLEGMDDRRVELVATVAGGQSEQGTQGTHRLTVIFDRNLPSLSKVEVAPREIKKLPAAAVRLLAAAADGPAGSGINSLSFVVGLDANNNRKLEESERSPSIPGKFLSNRDESQFVASYSMSEESPNGVYLVEAVAIDKAGHLSPVGTTSFKVAVVAKAPVGTERPSFGKEKKKEPATAPAP